MHFSSFHVSRSYNLVHPLSGLNRDVILSMLCAHVQRQNAVGILNLINCKVVAQAKRDKRICKPKTLTPVYRYHLQGTPVEVDQPVQTMQKSDKAGK